MQAKSIPAKTVAGREEIERRTRRLPSGLRSVLLLVDGQRTVEQMRDIARRIHAPEDALEQLQAMSLIGVDGAGGPEAATQVAAASAKHRPEDAERHRILYALMTDAIREHLGIRGYFLQIKLERANDAAELQALLPQLEAALAKARDPALAAASITGMGAAAGIGSG